MLIKPEGFFQLLLVVVIGFGTGFAQASAKKTTEFVTSIFNGGQPYMVVSGELSEERDSVEFESGLYAREGKNWHLVSPGHVLMDSHRGPWIHQLALSKISPQYFSLAIIDGQLILFNVHSRGALHPNSVKRIGDNLPVHELDTGRLVPLVPKIEDVRNVEVYPVEEKFPDGTQALLISVRSDLPGYPEMTMVVVLQANSPGEIEIFRGPFVLDYKFRTSREMAKLIRATDDEYEVYSDLFKNMPIQRLRRVPEAHRPLAQEALDRFQSLFQDDVRKAPITYDVLGEHMKVKSTPVVSREMKSGQFSIQQLYDVSSGAGWFAVKGRDIFKGPGFIDLKSSGSGGLSFLAEDSMRGHVVVSVEGKLLLFSETDKGILGPVNLGSVRELFEVLRAETGVQLSNLSISFVSLVDRSLKLLISCEVETSLEGGKGGVFGRTVLFDLVYMPNGDLALNKKHSIAPYFYTAGAMEKRKVTREKGPMFSVSNLAVTEESKIHSAMDVYEPYVNLNSSGENLEYEYLNPLRTIKISNSLVYREFKPHRKVENKTGLAFVQTGLATADVLSSVEGTLGSLEGGESESYLLNPQQTDFFYNHGGALIPMSIALVPLNRTQGQVLAIAIETKGAFPLQKILTVNMGSLHALESVFVVQGRDSFSNNFYVIHQYLDRESGSGASLQINGFKIGTQQDGRPVLEMTTAHVLRGNSVRDAKISERLVFDRSGKVYWIETPELDPKHRKWSLVSFESRSSSLPNADFSGRGPEFDHSSMYLGSKEGTWRAEADLRSPWTLSRDVVFRELKRQSASLSKAENLLFEDLDQEVVKMARPNESQQRLVILVPDEVREQFFTHLQRTYIEEERRNDFHYQNNALHLYRFNGKSVGYQEDVLTNVDLITKRHGGGVTSLLISKISDVKEGDRPKHGRSSEMAFQISIMDVDSDSTGVGQENLAGKKLLPHVLYLLDVGDTDELTKLRNPSVRAPFNIILVGSESEWNSLKSTMSHEERHGFFDSYKVVDFRALTPSSMALMMGHFLKQSDVLRLGYNYALDKRGQSANLSGQERIRDYLLELAATRIQTFAADRGQDVVRFFLKYYAKFTQAVVNDVYNGTIDRAFFERILSDVFNLSFNNEILPPNDPQVIASNDDYVIRLSREGFRGSYDMKYSLQSDILASQQADSTIAIPGSRIIVGPPGNGKSTFVRAEIRALGLREYRIAAGHDHPDNRLADAFVLSVGDLAESPTAFESRAEGRRVGAPPLTVEAAIQHMEHWLTLPKAQRGFLYIDDFDKGTEEIKKRLNQFLRKLTDARNGMDITSQFSGNSIEGFSPRGLKLRVIMNPPDNYKNMTRHQMAMESMSSKDYKVDESHLGRFREVDFWDRSASGGKTAQLRVDFMNQAKRTARDRQVGLLLSSPLVEALRKNFGADMDARTFIGGAINGLDILATQQVKDDVVYVLDLKTSEDGKPQDRAGDVGRGTIQKFISERAILRPVSLNSWEGLVRFVQQNIEAFRANIYESLIGAVRDNDRIAGDKLRQQDLLQPILLGIRDHLSQFSRISLADLRLNPSDFKIARSSDRRAFLDLIAEESRTVPVLNFEFSPDEEINNQVRSLRGQKLEANQRTRSHVLRGVQDQLSVVVEKALALGINVPDLRRIPSPKAWLGDLDQVKPYGEGSGSEIAGLLISALPLLVQSDLKEMSDPASQYAPDVYDLTRLFLVALERAIADLQWSQASQIMLSGLREATIDPIAIQSIAVQNFFFGNPNSLLRPVAMDDLTDYIDNIPLTSQVGEPERKGILKKYEQACSVLLSGSDGIR